MDGENSKMTGNPTEDEMRLCIRKNLKTLRISSRFPQKRIANILKINRATYAYYELGKTLPNIFKFIQLSELYGCSVEDFWKHNLWQSRE